VRRDHAEAADRTQRLDPREALLTRLLDPKVASC
jgi:hypothetical protein